MNEEFTLKTGEYHPSAPNALGWFNRWKMADFKRYMLMREAIASNAIEGNRLAEICHGTLERLDKHEPVSDRYLLGLCWFIRNSYDEEENS